MKIGFLTDSHENIHNIKKAVCFFNSQKIDFVFHGGDIISPIMASHLSKLDAELNLVFGNNDGEKLFLIEKFSPFSKLHEDFFEMNICNKRILVYHKPLFLDALIDSKHYDIILYGHTHYQDVRIGRVKLKEIDNDKPYKIDEYPLVINPGESCGYLTGKSHIAIIDLEKEIFKIHEI